MRLRIVLLNATHRLCVYRMVAVACGSCRSTLVLCNILYLLCFALRTQNFDIQLAARHVSKYWNWYKFRESMEFICHVVLNVYRSHYLTCSRKSLGHAGFALVPSFSKLIAPLWTSSQQAQSALVPTCFHFRESLGHAGFALVPSFSKFIAPLWTSSQQAQSALVPTCFHFRESLGHAGFALVPSFSKFIAPLWTSSQQAQSALLPTCFHFIASLWTFSPKVLDSGDNTATSMLRLWHSYRCFRFLACKNKDNAMWIVLFKYCVA